MPQQVDSPPPKPPRRKLSDHLSVSLGTICKKQDESPLTNASKENILRAKSVLSAKYLSLPSSLTTNQLYAYNSSTSGTRCPNFSDEHKLYSKTLPESLVGKCLLQPGGTQTLQDLNINYVNKETFERDYQGSDNYTSSKSHCANLGTCTVNKLLRSIVKSNAVLSKRCDNQSLKKNNIYHHRRCHSDSTISYFNMSKQSLYKFKMCDCRSVCFCCKNNYFLSNEIQSLKEINEKLWQHLCSVQTSLENIKKKNYEKSTEISISGLLSSIYYAQKAKDSSIEKRLNIALEERDLALWELENITSVLSNSLDTLDTLDCGENKVNEKTMNLLDEIECSVNPSSLLQLQKELLTHLCTLKTLKEEGISYEVRCAMNERNRAVEKAKKLEEQIDALKMCFDLLHLDNKHWEITLLDVLQQLVDQRDNLRMKVENNLCANSAMLRKEYSDKYPVPQYTCRSKSCNSHHCIDNDEKNLSSFSKTDESKKLREEIINLKAELDDEKIKREQAERKCFRLERLIHTLQIKLNGENIGMPV